MILILINISAENDEAFKYACQHGFLNVVKWLCELLPLKYHVEIYDNKIINCQINSIPINENHTPREMTVVPFFECS